MARQKSKVLTDTQALFVDAKMEGLTDFAAAKAAGLGNGTATMRSLKVQEEIARARSEISDLTTLKRVDIVDGIMRAISMAEMMADPQAMIKGYTEVGKILGLYSPEVKKVELTLSQGRMKSKFESLSDEELLAITGGTIIEGELSE